MVNRIDNANGDWHRAEIVAAVKKRGKTISQLSVDAGLSKHTLKSALQFHYPKGERIIADFLGLKPEQIWPTRYANKSLTA
ncbi:helix-turn-helix domain-containing protein [Neisseria sp. Dent CA1/247]|uniref:helix-turn-helix domain-containing protein n=1 Tax=Neisseria sp. Dent CA1/247 TaxID=2912675 RepID=UPI001FD3BEE7|nr:helix-turn-helix transcriptional regulator [Neisseria sp. Dent CA1/247]UOO77354.1 helix-turn-helix domain-containing protein [Neisseria sp. Dent CA1/247]